MNDFTDPEAFAGRIGALSAFGPVSALLSWTFPLRFGLFRLAYRLNEAYNDLDEIQELFALRWSLIRLPGIKRPYLLFETIFIDDWESYLKLLLATSSIGIETHSAGLAGYPGLRSANVFLEYLAERHRPSIHLFAANPKVTIRDINRRKPPHDRVRATWCSVIFEVPPGRVDHVRAVMDSWRSADGSRSGFSGPSKFIHHGRVVFLQEKGRTFLLLTAVHTAKPGTPKPGFRSRFRRDVRRSDKALLTDLVGTTQIDPRWAQLFSAIEKPFDSAAGAIDWLLSNRNGVRRRDAIRYVDGLWGRSPETLAELFRKPKP
jgi:hypothetical protein